MQSTRPLHLIIDGPDRVGKTTVIKLLARDLKLPVIKMKDMPKYFKGNPEEASEIFNKTLAQFRDTSFICDRGFPSSMVYSWVFDRHYDLKYLTKVEKALQPKVVILYRNKPRAEDKLVDSKFHKKVTETYVSMARALNWTVIDVKNLKPEQICKKIKEII